MQSGLDRLPLARPQLDVADSLRTASSIVVGSLMSSFAAEPAGCSVVTVTPHESGECADLAV